MLITHFTPSDPVNRLVILVRPSAAAVEERGHVLCLTCRDIEGTVIEPDDGNFLWSSSLGRHFAYLQPGVPIMKLTWKSDVFLESAELSIESWRSKLPPSEVLTGVAIGYGSHPTQFNVAVLSEGAER